MNEDAVVNSCGVSLARQSNLPSSNGVQLFSCSWCIKSFRRRDHLKNHIKVHTGEKSHSCSLCDKSFANYEKLKIHCRIHTGERPHNCSLCDKSFASSEKLKIHCRIHTGEKPFSCSECSRSFTQISHLKQYDISHWREVFQLFRMFKVILTCSHSEETYQSSYWR